MDNYLYVRQEHLNTSGNLFGGHMLLWIDEMAWLAVSLDFPNRKFVTLALAETVFKRSVKLGSILRFNSKLVKKGTTAATYEVNVYARERNATEEFWVFATKITFVCVDNEGKKKPIDS